LSTAVCVIASNEDSLRLRLVRLKLTPSSPPKMRISKVCVKSITGWMIGICL
jgi:hypothetical protein